ncbi:hypothetical protein EVAR_98457_1 [Eumeta japonica]|uniref:Uncharacterized protein n=1 Tax=Eumeta variegata TaxID=151549 RepID=A0A4C1YSF0_EUMVA|nr:hypothetical protein EVAR_98457_1 [Eumeta japonica]
MFLLERGTRISAQRQMTAVESDAVTTSETDGSTCNQRHRAVLEISVTSSRENVCGGPRLARPQTGTPPVTRRVYNFARTELGERSHNLIRTTGGIESKPNVCPIAVAVARAVTKFN